MLKISARKLLQHPTQELWNMLTGEFTLVMDDGEIQTNAKECLYSSYVWDIHRNYDNAPILIQHHVRSVLNSKRMRSDTHLKLIGQVLWSTYDWASEGLDDQQKLKLRYHLAEQAYRITNNLYNDLSYRCEQYTSSLDILDFVEILKHDDVQDAYKQLNAKERIHPDDIVEVYTVISKLLNSPDKVGSNPLSRLHRSSLIKENQLHQCLGPRGFVTDVDSHQFVEPVLRGYVEGLRTAYNSIVESRSAAKSLVFSKDPLRAAEYFARRLQLVCMTLENVHQGDCGSTKYVRWTVRGTESHEGKITYDGDLRQLVGKYYLGEDQQLKAIKASDTHLIGKTLNLRSVLHCYHPDPSGVCATCVGQLGELVPAHSNIGHMASTYMTQQSSQTILSVKHLDGSAVVEAIMLQEADKYYLKVGQDRNTYRIADGLKNKKVKLIIPGNRAANLTDVMEIDDVYRLTISRVSELETVGLMVDDGKVVRQSDAVVNQNRRYASMTHDLLEHIRRNGWTLDEFGNYIIDMTGWDWTKPILALPLKHFNMSDHSKDIADMLEASMKEVMNRDRFINPESFLGDLFILVNSKLNVNLAIIELVLKAGMVVSAEKFDYSIPKPWTEAGLGVMRPTMDYRSLAPRMAYERHYNVFVNPMSFVLSNRVETPFDGVLMPREVYASGSRER
jgi:hypothetical protein